MKSKIFILLLVNIVLFLFIFYKSENEIEQNSFIELTFPTISQFSSFSIETQDNHKLEVVHKEDNLWHSETPLSWEISQFIISDLISNLANLEAVHFSNSEDLYGRGEKFSDYGISNDSQKLHLNSDTSYLILTKGHPTRDQKFHYFLVEYGNQQQSMWKIEKSFTKFFDLSLIDWIDRSILTSPIFSIDKIALSTNDQNNSKIVSLSRNENKWKMMLPMSSEVDHNELLFLLNKIATIEIIDVVEKSVILDNNLWDCNFTFQSMSQTTSIRFQYFQQDNQDRIVCSSSSWEQSFLVNPESKLIFEDWSNRIRDKKLWSLSLNKIEKIKISNQENILTLRRKDINFWIGNESKLNSDLQKTYPLDSAKVNDLIFSLNDIQISDLLLFNPNQDDLLEEGFITPSHTLEIEFSDSTKSLIHIDKTSDEVSFWKTFVVEKSLICLTQTNWDLILKADIKKYMTREVVKPETKFESINFSLKDDNSSVIIISKDVHGDLFETIKEITANEIVQDNLDPDGIWNDGNWLPWIYKADFYENSKITNSILLSKNSTNWFGGSSYSNTMFSVSPKISNSLGKLLTEK